MLAVWIVLGAVLPLLATIPVATASVADAAAAAAASNADVEERTVRTPTGRTASVAHSLYRRIKQKIGQRSALSTDAAAKPGIIAACELVCATGRKGWRVAQEKAESDLG